MQRDRFHSNQKKTSRSAKEKLKIKRQHTPVDCSFFSRRIYWEQIKTKKVIQKAFVFDGTSPITSYLSDEKKDKSHI